MKPEGERRGKRPWGALLLVAAGGLVLAGSTSTDWVRDEAIREVGGVELSDIVTVGGVAIAPEAVAAGVVAAIGSLALLLPVVRLQRLIAAALALVGAGGLTVVGVALPKAVALPGDVTAAPFVAAVAAGLVIWGGVVGLIGRGARGELSDRYSVEGADDDDEWRAASGDA